MRRAGRVLLDTNLVIALFAGESAVARALAGTAEVLVPSIVVGELYYGAACSRRPRANAERLRAFTAVSTVLPCDAVTAHFYGLLKAELRRQGTPIPENDLWIAALARQHEALLATRDGHFRVVAGLSLDAWVE